MHRLRRFREIELLVYRHQAKFEAFRAFVVGRNRVKFDLRAQVTGTAFDFAHNVTGGRRVTIVNVGAREDIGLVSRLAFSMLLPSRWSTEIS